MKNVSEYLRGFERTNWTIIGAMAGILTKMLLGIYSTVDSQVSIIAGLAVAIIFLQIGEIAHKDRVAEILGPYYDLRKDIYLQHRVEALIKFYIIARDFNNEMFMSRARSSLDAFVDALSLLADGRLQVAVHEDLLFTIELLNSCKGKLMAASWQNKIEYWDSPEGKNYVEAHRDFIQCRRGKVTRVFIIRRDEVKDYIRIMKAQADLGIEIRVAIAETLHTDLLEGFVVYDDSAVRLERWISGAYLSAILSIDPNEVRNYVRKYTELYLRSELLAGFMSKHGVNDS